jgi:hypothetical protein
MLASLAFHIVCLFCANVIGQYTVGQEVKTSSGLVRGHASKAYPEVSEYLGIRFGISTAGENRFMPPKPYISTDKVDASDYVSYSDPNLCGRQLRQKGSYG